jgi:hypothetical protein
MFCRTFHAIDRDDDDWQAFHSCDMQERVLSLIPSMEHNLSSEPSSRATTPHSHYDSDDDERPQNSYATRDFDSTFFASPSDVTTLVHRLHFHLDARAHREFSFPRNKEQREKMDITEREKASRYHVPANLSALLSRVSCHHIFNFLLRSFIILCTSVARELRRQWGQAS